MEGKWSDHFPAAAQPPPRRYKRSLLCTKCNNSICRLVTATKTTTENNGRKFYTCPAKDHNFFKWEEDVKDDDLIDVPECGGCSAGTCRVRRETSGRILFMCRVKEGEGSCGYRVYKDELEMSETVEENESIPSFQPTLTECEYTNLTNPDLVEKSKENDEGGNNESPVIENSSHHVNGLKATSWKMERSNCQEVKYGESSKRPSKRSRYGDVKAPCSLASVQSLALCLDINSVSIKQQCWMEIAIHQNLSTQLQGWWGRLAFHPVRCLTKPPSKHFTCYVSSPPDPSFSVQDKITRTLLGVENCKKSLFNAPNAQSQNYPPRETRFPNVMTKSISKAFGELAELLQNKLLALLETMDVSDHEAMNESAQDTFAALDRLFFDHHHMKDRADNLIHCAQSLAEIEQSMPTNEYSYKKLVDHCSSERNKLDKINSTHAKAVDMVTNNKKRVKFLHDEICSTKDWLFQVESELSCSEVELRNMEHELERISNDKEVLEGKYVIVSKELEESQELQLQREAEREVAKAAFDRARALLRG